jgi:hypothetical protein
MRNRAEVSAYRASVGRRPLGWRRRSRRAGRQTHEQCAGSASTCPTARRREPGLSWLARSVGLSAVEPGGIQSHRRLQRVILAGTSASAAPRREGVSPSYFTRLVRLSYLAPDYHRRDPQWAAPPDLTAEKLLEHSRLPLACTISAPSSVLPELRSELDNHRYR